MCVCLNVLVFHVFFLIIWRTDTVNLDRCWNLLPRSVYLRVVIICICHVLGCLFRYSLNNFFVLCQVTVAVSDDTDHTVPFIHWFFLRQQGWDGDGGVDEYIILVMLAWSLVSRVPQHDSLLLIADSLCHGFPPVQLPTVFPFHWAAGTTSGLCETTLPFCLFKLNISHINFNSS